jgi:DNA-binding transcriptional ArsR family regulator
MLKSMLNHSSVDQVFQALGDPTRRAIVERLCLSPGSATDLAGPLDLTLAAVVQHLQVLERSGLIQTTKVGRVRTCHLNTDGLRVADEWIRQRRALWERRLDRLGDVLAADPKPQKKGKQHA